MRTATDRAITLTSAKDGEESLRISPTCTSRDTVMRSFIYLPIQIGIKR